MYREYFSPTYIKFFCYYIYVSQNIGAAQFRLFIEAKDWEELSLWLGIGKPVIKWRNSF